MSAPSRSRDPAMDALRVLAIVMVVVIHCASYGLSAPMGSFRWWSALSWASLVRPAVPLFFLCSGALLLGRDIPLRRLYGHNILRILLALLFWAFFYRVYGLAVDGGLTPRGLWEAVKHTLLFHHEFHLYFLHILLLVYVCLPVTRAFVRAASRREAEYALAVWAVCGVLFPLLRYFWPFSLAGVVTAWWLLPAGWSSIGCGVLGWYLLEYGGGIPRRYFALAFALGLGLTLGGGAAASIRAGALSEIFWQGWSPGPMLMAAGLFGLLALRGAGWKPRLRRALARGAKASFCVYLVHVFFLYALRDAGITAQAIPALLIPAVTALILLLGGLVYAVLCRIPIVNRYLI